jgi:quinol monooxygenase YgiN
MVIGFVIIRTKPDRRDDVLREYQAVVPMVLEERGCIDYGAVVDEYFGPPQSLLGDDAFAIIEKWETKQHFESHAVSEHMKTCRAKGSGAGCRSHISPPFAHLRPNRRSPRQHSMLRGRS